PALSLVSMSTPSLPHARVTVTGGACALGPPIGASGARILVPLLAALRQRHQWGGPMHRRRRAR
ncbi:acetyl-CoA C-acetyltransferase, partial [Pseudomonas lactis]|nr:acetyl-CoA C-acetyltransferase [Pseudomonas lactis]